MKLKFTEYPVEVDKLSYHEALSFMTNELMNTGKVKAVYQVGGISAPGISDLDLYVVFKSGETFSENPVSKLEFPKNYLFSHKLFGTSESLAPEMEKFTFFGKYDLLEGEPIDLFNYQHSATDIKLLKSQIALEYLVKAWIAISIGMAFGTIKLRSFLLHAKAVQYDMDFLEIKNVKLSEIINRVVEIRNNWFSNKPTESELQQLVEEFSREVFVSIEESIKKHSFYIPSNANMQIAGKIQLLNSNRLNILRKGNMLPASLTSKSKTLFKINNRLNTFTVEIPITSTAIPEIIEKRFTAISAAFKYNSMHLPYFICTGHGLNIFHSNN